jgi:hypothetical protein
MTPASDWVVDGGRGALDFDGSNDYVDFGNILNFERTQPFTISAWVRVRSFASAGSIANKMQSANLRGYLFFYNTDSTLGFIMRSASAGNRISVSTTGAALTLDVWGHVVVAYNGTSQASGVRFFSNGALMATSTAENTLSATIANSQSLLIGGRAVFNDLFVDAQMDDIRIFRTALIAADARQLWQLGRGNMPMVRKRRHTEEAAAGFKAYWARRQSQIIGGGV